MVPGTAKQAYAHFKLILQIVQVDHTSPKVKYVSASLKIFVEGNRIFEMGTGEATNLEE